MGAKDITEKLLEDHNDVFADIINVVLFNGKQVILPETLTNSIPKSQYKADDAKMHEQERDVSKIWEKGNTAIVLYGIENQTRTDKNMPVRMIGYDGVSYRSQLLQKGNIYPVVSLVLYFGMEHWNYPLSLKEIMDVPEELDEYINDYKIKVCEVAWLTDEQVSMFKSDFRIIADYFTQMRKNGIYEPENLYVEHMDEVLKFMSVFTNDERYQWIVESGKSKEVHAMCKALDLIEEKGRLEGIKQSITNALESGLTIENVAKILKVPMELVQSCAEKEHM